jgi:cell wall-associated NlpC family hydrolase
MKRFFLFSLALLLLYTPAYAADPISADVLKFEPNGTSMKVLGKIDKTKHPNPELFNILLEYSPVGPFTVDGATKPAETLSAEAWNNEKITVAGTVIEKAFKGVNSDGTYFFTLTNIDPVTYWYRQSFYTKTGTEAGLAVIGKFNGDTGVELSTPTNEKEDFERRSYRLLAPLPGLSVLLDPDLCREKQVENPDKGYLCNISDFLNYAMKLLIGISAVILVVRMMIEGFRYATSDVLNVKIKSKEALMQSVWGLLLALSAWLILNTINPRLVENDIALQGVYISLEDLEGDNDSYQTAITYTGGTAGLAGYNFKNARFPSGVVCPGQTGGTGDINTIARSFIGKVTYNQLTSPQGYPPRGNPGPNGTFMLDCSSYVSTVLMCAGVTPPYSYAQTSTIFKGKERVTSVEAKDGKGYVNGKELKPGDLIGWTAEDKVKGVRGGHVVIYIGNGLVIQSVGGKNNGRLPGKSVKEPQSLTSSYLKDKYRWVSRI